jgi:hypothetical protein
MKGFRLKPKTKQIEVADEELKKQLAPPTSSEETVGVEASPVTSKTRAMFKETPAEKDQKKAMGGPSVAPGSGIFPTAVRAVAKPSAPLAKAEAPLAKPSAPLAKAEAPLVKAEAKPVARKEAELVSPFEEVDLSAIPEGETNSASFRVYN